MQVHGRSRRCEGAFRHPLSPPPVPSLSLVCTRALGAGPPTVLVPDRPQFRSICLRSLPAFLSRMKSRSFGDMGFQTPPALLNGPIHTRKRLQSMSSPFSRHAWVTRTQSMEVSTTMAYIWGLTEGSFQRKYV